MQLYVAKEEKGWQRERSGRLWGVTYSGNIKEEMLEVERQPE
jgi:hypothetical protein